MAAVGEISQSLGISGWASAGMLSDLWAIAKFLFVFLILALIAIAIYYYFQKEKRYKISIMMIVETSDNKVLARDMAAVIKDSGGERLVMKKRRQSIPVPDRKFWMLTEGGKFTIFLYKYGEDEHTPVRALSLKEIKKIFKKPQLEDFEELEGTEAIDLKKQIKLMTDKVNFIPMPSDSKSHFMIQTKQNVQKHQREMGFVQKHAAIIQISMGVVMVLMIAFWGFGFTERAMDKGIKSSETCLKESEKILENIDNYCLRRQPAPASPEPSELPPRPAI